MNQTEATSMVTTALEQRRKFGKHFGVRDMPPEFLDALVIEFDRLRQCADLDNAAANAAADAEAQVVALREQLTLANRQLGAAKSRETQLRKQLADAQPVEKEGAP